ncbi:hypothetical protein ACFLZX_01120 [Nanoarchaeota archaeon]
MIKDLLEVFKSNIKALEILALLNDIKPAGRILVKENEIRGVVDFLEKKGLICLKSNFKMLKTDSGPYSDKGEKVKSDDSRKGYFILYLGREKEIVEKLKSLEGENKHYELGLTLGYPECCCKFFSDKFNENETDLTYRTLRNSEGKVFDFHINNAMRHFDIALIFHFPCSYQCEKSIEIAKQNLKLLQGNGGELFRVFSGMLKGGIIYTSSNVILLRNAKILEKKLYYEGLMALKNNAMYQQLKNSKYILVKESGFRVKNIDYSSNLMLFI